MNLLNLDALKKGTRYSDPYPHFQASGALKKEDFDAFETSFPDPKKPGFFPLSMLKSEGAFGKLIEDLQSPELAEVVGNNLGIDLRDKPRMITVRKWSALKDGRIHNDGEAKIVTSLIYFNKDWSERDGGAVRVLRSDKSFDDTQLEVPPLYGNFFAFRRTDNSWHGHKPFEGKRHVIQITWLRSQEDLERKEKRGRLSYFLKKLFGKDY